MLTEREAAQVAHDVLRVLEACHEQGILYADIKPANFLLAQPYPDTRELIHGNAAQQPIQIRVADFGCAQRIIKVRLRLLVEVENLQISASCVLLPHGMHAMGLRSHKH